MLPNLSSHNTIPSQPSHLYQFAFKNQERSFEFMSNNDILREQAHRRSELRRALVSEEGSLDGMKANRHFFIFECKLVLHLPRNPLPPISFQNLKNKHHLRQRKLTVAPQDSMSARMALQKTILADSRT